MSEYSALLIGAWIVRGSLSSSLLAATGCLRSLVILRTARLSRALSLIATFILLLSSTARAANDQPSGRLEVQSELAVSSDVIPRWCYEVEPAFIFVQERSLYRANLAGESQLIQTVDAPTDNLTLRCSLDGKIIFFLSAQHEFAYVVQNDAVSKYELRKDFAEIGVRYGSLMSPDGSTFVLGLERLVSGPDALAEKKIVDLKAIYPNSGNIFWTKQYMIRPSERVSSSQFQEFRFENFRREADHGETRRLRLPRSALVDNIEECGSQKYAVTYWGKADSLLAEMFTIGRPNARTRVLSGKLIGELNSSAGGCLLPIMSQDRGIYHADSLLLLSDDATRTFELPRARNFSDRFYLSKDLKHAITYETTLPRSEPIRGRIVVLRIIPTIK